jgi:hypothetical protein
MERTSVIDSSHSTAAFSVVKSAFKLSFFFLLEEQATWSVSARRRQVIPDELDLTFFMSVAEEPQGQLEHC